MKDLYKYTKDKSCSGNVVVLYKNGEYVYRKTYSKSNPNLDEIELVLPNIILSGIGVPHFVQNNASSSISLPQFLQNILINSYNRKIPLTNIRT